MPLPPTPVNQQRQSKPQVRNLEGETVAAIAGMTSSTRTIPTSKASSDRQGQLSSYSSSNVSNANAEPRLYQKLQVIDKVWSMSNVKPKRKLRICMLIPHHNVSGGMKMLMEQLRYLRSSGHHVCAMFRSPLAANERTAGQSTTVLPPWSDVKVDQQILVDPGESLQKAIPADTDVVIAGYFTQVSELDGCFLPVFYWEQGNEHVFGDVSSDNSVWDAVFAQCFTKSVCFAAVSPAVQSILKVRFNRSLGLIPNGIDCKRFTPGLQDSAPPNSARILLVGHPLLPLKGHDIALAALNQVMASVPQLQVTWMCQSMPSSVLHVNFPISFVVQPRQEDIPRIYQQHDILIYSSRYEGFGMPPLEAMASRCAVVTTDCFGIGCYAVHGTNCLKAPVSDVNTLAKHTIQLIHDRAMATRLRDAGQQTANSLSWSRALEGLEDSLYRCSILKSIMPKLCAEPVSGSDIQACHLLLDSPDVCESCSYTVSSTTSQVDQNQWPPPWLNSEALDPIPQSIPPNLQLSDPLPTTSSGALASTLQWLGAGTSAPLHQANTGPSTVASCVGGSLLAASDNNFYPRSSQAVQPSSGSYIPATAPGFFPAALAEDSTSFSSQPLATHGEASLHNAANPALVMNGQNQSNPALHFNAPLASNQFAFQMLLAQQNPAEQHHLLRSGTPAEDLVLTQHHAMSPGPIPMGGAVLPMSPGIIHSPPPLDHATPANAQPRMPCPPALLQQPFSTMQIEASGQHILPSGYPFPKQ